MSTNTTTSIPTSQSIESLIAAYYSLILTIVGTLMNSMTFIIFCRSTFRDTRARPTLHYMRTIAIFDMFMLYGWNLNHYLIDIQKFHILRYSIVSCKFITFLSYFSAQTSAWLRVFVCLDRYLVFTRLHRTWFSKSKHVLIIIACILTALFLLNFHILLFVCYQRPNGTIAPLSWLYEIYPLWDYVNLAVYNCLPFIIMITFNISVIYHLIILKRTRTIQNSQLQHYSITIPLVSTTFLFLIMTVPSTIAFAFFSSANSAVLHFLDGLLYSYHSLSFLIYLITFEEFRHEFIGFISCKTNHRRVVPHNGSTLHPLPRV